MEGKKIMKSENGYGRSVCRRLYVMLLGLFLILTSFHLYMVKAEENETKTVRVGFFACPFNIRDENGHMSGYAYDYQQDIAAYTGWDYEYMEGPDQHWCRC